MIDPVAAQAPTTRDAGPTSLRPDTDDSLLAAPSSLLETHGLYVALLVAWVATLGSLYFSEVMHFIPCRLCWFQRILMYPLALVIPVGLLRRDRGLPLYVLPLTALGIAVSGYHLLVERGYVEEGTACQVGASCAIRWINWFGFVTIPLLAFTAFILITLAGSAVLRAPAPEVEAPDGAPRPWKAVAAVIAAVCGFFVLLGLWHSGPPTPS